MEEMKSNDVYLDSDGTLGISADVDISKVKRILLTQEGAHYGSMYYIDDSDHIVEVSKKVECPTFEDSSQYAQPDNRFSKIAELVERTIDHFDLDDTMDLLYQIKEIVGNETSNIRG